MTKIGDSSVGIVGGAAVPHAPQFFTLPETEDHHQVGRIEALLGRIGEELRDLELDFVVIVANDHLENFFLEAVPSFTVHCGPEAGGSFAGREFAWPIASEHAYDVVRALQDQDFDPAFTLTSGIGYEFGIPLTFLGLGADTRLLPIYVNSYVAPQPRPERCYAFGQALHRSFAMLGLRVGIIASGGLSHYPGTERYAEPDIPFDEALFRRIKEGNLRALVGYDDHQLDETGNVEIRSWQILAGALGERKPDHSSFEPSWHHTYVSFGWTSGERVERPPLHYPPVASDQVEIVKALYGLRRHPENREAYLDDPTEYAHRFDLSASEREALYSLDEEQLRALNIHPLIGFLARLQVDLHKERNHPTQGN